MSDSIVDPASAQVRITMQLRNDVARELDLPDRQSPATRNLTSLLERTSATIEPVFSDVVDSNLESWFTVLAPEHTAPDLLTRLQRLEAVLAAYIKPREALP